MQGFDVALIDLVAEDLGVKQEILDQPFENFKTGGSLNAGQCDLAAAGMTITEERKKNVDFSDPYFDATQAVLADKKSGISSFADLKGKKAGAQAQTTGEDYAKSKGLDPVSSSPPTPSSTACAPARSRRSSSTTRWSRAG
ncbi:Membrane-bound lytic murein transglycosylase F [Streptomyces glaucescens]